MRYRCRLPGWTDAIERKYPGTYNARRDRLETSWSKVFGQTHAVIVASAFYEHVDLQGRDAILEFRPRGDEVLVAACLYTQTIDANGFALCSFQAITAEPPPAEIGRAHV